MGIYGLTSYVAQHHSNLLDDCKLHNCAVLVDGNSAASLIYSNLTRSNHAFGGDYDRYANSIRDFVRLLRKCDLTPIFVFDGGYEQRKLRTVLERIRMNIVVCGQYKNKYRESKSFPLMLRDTCRAVLNELRVTVVQCDFEADNELVVLCRILGCPLISYDSDFYITDARYVPFTSIDFRAVRLKKSQRKYYLPCKAFNVDTFLDRFGGVVDKSLLPLLSCMLGNDYIPRNTFKHFLQLDHMASFEERIRKIVQWMANIVSVDEAIDQMVAFVQKNKTGMKNKINHILFEYNRTTSSLLEFIPQDVVETSLRHALENLSITNCHVTPKRLYEPTINQSDIEASPMAGDEECVSLPCSDDDDDDIIILETEEYEIPYSDDDVIEPLEESRDDNTVEQKKGTEWKTNEMENFHDNSVNSALNETNFETSVDDSSVYIIDESESQCDLDTSVGEQKKETEWSTEMENFQDNSTNDIDDSALNETNFETSIDDSSVVVNESETTFCFKVPEWFLRKYRRGIITPNLINVINFHRWFIPSQSEDYFSKPSHEISLPILQAVVGITLGEIATVTKVKCHARTKAMNLGVYDITPVFEVQAQPLPGLLTVTSIPAEVRASVLVDCLGLPKTINLRLFPQEWRLYMLILMYWKNHCKQPAVNESHIRAVILCLIYLSVIDPKVGFVRLASDLRRLKKEKRRSDKLSKAASSSKILLADATHVADLSDVTKDSLSADLPADSSKMEDLLSVNDQSVSVPEITNPETLGDSISNSAVIGDPLPVEKTCESLPLVDRDTPRTDADHSVVDGEALQVDGDLFVLTADFENELFTKKGEYDSANDFLDRVSEEDCYTSAMALLNYHQVNPTLLKNRKDFDLKLIHSLAQLQHCIQSICVLNSVLDFPFVQCQPHSCFSGTFLYNFYSELNHRKLADGYITRTVLTKAGTIIALYRYLISSWEAVTSKKVVRPKFDVKKKKKKKGAHPVAVEISNPVEQELYHDPDNIYSMLPEE